MRKLETFEWWPQLLAMKDELSLRELAQRFEVTPGAISAALRRTGTSRRASPPGPKPASTGPIVAADPWSSPPGAPPRAEARPRPPRARPAVAPSRVDPPVGMPSASGRDHAWQVVIREGDSHRISVVVAATVVDAARKAARAAGNGDVVGVSWVGEVL